MPLKTWNQGRLLALDVDGVMIDPCGSFERCAAMAISDMAPGLAWSDDLYWGFKRVPGFNNDFRLAAAAVSLFEAGGMGALEGALRAAAPPPDLERRIGELEPRCKERVQLHYRDTAHLERPLIALAELEGLEGWDVAMLTGRPPEEMAMAFGVLGFEMPAVCDSAPELRKPAPGGLLRLADEYGADRIYFVGDTIDDAACLAAARRARPGARFTFVAVGRLRHEIAKPGDLAHESLRAFISSGELSRR